jgi:hypothetical protein
VVSDVPVDDEAAVVTSRISISAGAQSFRGGAHRGRVCVHVFIGVSVYACCERLRCTVSISTTKKSESKTISSVHLCPSTFAPSPVLRLHPAQSPPLNIFFQPRNCPRRTSSTRRRLPRRPAAAAQRRRCGSRAVRPRRVARWR